MKILSLEHAILKAKKMAEDKIAKGKNADEFVLIGEADHFKIYVTVGKTLKNSHSEVLHENQRDVFMLVLQGEMELTFERRQDGGKSWKLFCLAEAYETQVRFQEHDSCD